MNLRIVFYLVSMMVTAVSAAMLASAGVSFVMGDPEQTVLALALTACIILAVSGGTAFSLRPRNESQKKAGMREGFAIVGLSWIFATLAGMIPYMTVCGLNWYDALFETASGFSTTGATTLEPGITLWNGSDLPDGIESLPAGMLFWRALTQWLGGMGIVVLSLAILPLMNMGGQLLYNAEVSGLKSKENKIAPRIADSAKILWSVYLLLTAVQAVATRIAGMNWFDSVCHALTTLSTGGFSNYNDSLAHSSPAIQWIVLVFMFLGGCNFVLHYHFFTRQHGQYLRDEEFRFYSLLLLAGTLLITLSLLFTPGINDKLTEVNYGSDITGTIRTAAFQAISLMTTTGFSTADYAAWPALACIVLYLLMFTTACGGSTTGGIKCVRILVLLKYSVTELKRCIFPHRMQDIRINNIRCENTTIQKTIGFCAMYFILVLLFGTVITIFDRELNFHTAVTASLTCLANIGPGFDQVGPQYTFNTMSPATKVLLAFEMLLGRLELYTVLVLFLPSFWKK